MHKRNLTLSSFIEVPVIITPPPNTHLLFATLSMWSLFSVWLYVALVALNKIKQVTFFKTEPQKQQVQGQIFIGTMTMEARVKPPLPTHHVPD